MSAALDRFLVVWYAAGAWRTREFELTVEGELEPVTPTVVYRPARRFDADDRNQVLKELREKRGAELGERRIYSVRVEEGAAKYAPRP